MQAFFLRQQRVLGLGFLFVLQGCAQRLDDVETRIQDLQSRTSSLEAKSGMPVGSDRELLEGKKLADVRSQLASIRNEVTVLLGKVEALEYENKAIVQRLNHMALEVEKRQEALDELKRRSDVPGSKAEAPIGDSDSKPPVPDVPAKASASQTSESLYNNALKAHQDGQFEQSEKLFEQFIKLSPNSSLVDNALYWIGEGYMAQDKPRKAITSFQKLIERYGSSDKRCDAMGRQIEALTKLGMTKEAETFKKARTSECTSRP